MEIDYGLALDFIDDRAGDPRPYQLRFRRESHVSDQGQLIAVVATYNHPDNGHTKTISQPGVNFHDVERVLEGWQGWARLSEHTVSLSRIADKIIAAGVGANPA